MENLSSKELAEKVNQLSHDDFVMFTKELYRIKGVEMVVVEIVKEDNKFTKN